MFDTCNRLKGIDTESTDYSELNWDWDWSSRINNEGGIFFLKKKVGRLIAGKDCVKKRTHPVGFPCASILGFKVWTD